MPRARQGSEEPEHQDVARLEEWMDAYGNDVVHLAYTYMRSYHKAEDIAQDVFLRAWKNMHTFQGQSSVKTWLLSITANRCKDILRSWAMKHEQSDDGERLQVVVAPEDTAQTVSEQLERDRLWKVVHSLPEKYREVVVLYYQRELSSHEVAQVLDISEQAVRTRLHRGRHLLKEALAKEGMGTNG